MDIQSAEVPAFLSLFNDFADFISKMGKEISGQCAESIEEIDSAVHNPDSAETLYEVLRQSVIRFIKEPTVASWLTKEKEYKENRYATESLNVGETLRKTMEQIDLMEETQSRQTTPVTNLLERVNQYFTELKNFSAQAEEIHDKHMNNILKQQEEQVRSDIKGLIERQLRILDNDERWQSLSRRRKEALGIE